MAATIGNFSSGDVLTAAQMNTLGLEFLDDQTFTGFGGVVSDVLSSDFTHYMVQWFGTNANTSALSLQFRRSGSQITTNNYNYGTNGVTFNTSAAFTNAAQNTNIFRLGTIATGHSFMSMFLTPKCWECGERHLAIQLRKFADISRNRVFRRRQRRDRFANSPQQR